MIYVYIHIFFWGLGPSGYAWTSSTDFWCCQPFEQLEQGLQAGLWCASAVMLQESLRQLERFCAQAAPVINEALWVVAAVPFCAVLLEQWGGQLLSRALELQENLVTLVTLEVKMVKWDATDWDVMSTEMWCLGLKNEAPVDPQFG